MKEFKLFVSELLQQEVEVEAENIEEALAELERLYHEGEVVLDYSNLIDTEFSNCELSKKEIQIMGEIGKFCEECPSCDCCPEGECVLYRIEKIIENGYFREVTK